MTHTAAPARSERIAHALQANGLDWDGPVVDLIDSLIYDGGFTAEQADAIVGRKLGWLG
jgi:hypothetical protein